MVLAEEKEVVYAPEKCYFDGNWTKKIRNRRRKSDNKNNQERTGRNSGDSVLYKN